jgi:ABC-type sugar transport system substrate-binding protein
LSPELVGKCGRGTYAMDVERAEERRVKKLRIVVSLPNDNAYQHEQGIVARAVAQQLGLDLRVIHSNDDSITQSQQLLEIIHSSPENRPNAFLVEPGTSTGLRRVGEAAVSEGIGWVISNTDVDYVKQLRAGTNAPVFMVSQGQTEIGRLQGQQMSALLPNGGSVLFVKGPSMGTVAAQRVEGMESVKPQNVKLATLRSKWSQEGAYHSAVSWLQLATSRAEKFDLVAAQTHELALGTRKAFQEIASSEQRNRWLEMPCIAIGISSQVKPLVDRRVLKAAVVTSVTMELALRLLVRAFETQVQPVERTIVEMYSYPPLEGLSPKA